MRYIWITLVLFMITGCGGGSGSDNNTPPASPQTHDSGNKPPAVPVID